MRIMNIVDEHGAEFAFPTRTLHMHTSEPGGRDDEMEDDDVEDDGGDPPPRARRKARRGNRNRRDHRQGWKGEQDQETGDDDGE